MATDTLCCRMCGRPVVRIGATYAIHATLTDHVALGEGGAVLMGWVRRLWRMAMWWIQEPVYRVRVRLARRRYRRAMAR